MSVTVSDDGVVYVKVQPQSATAADAPEGGPTRRRDARTRAREETPATDITESDHPGWVARAAETLRGITPRTLTGTAPAGLGELWDRVRAAADSQEALAARSLAYLLGGAGVAACAALYAIAAAAGAPWRAGWLPSLDELWEAVSCAADGREETAVRRAVYMAGAVCWAIAAACYGAAYAITYPAMAVGLMVCAAAAALSYLT